MESFERNNANEKFNAILSNHFSILQDQYKNIESFFVYGSFSSGKHTFKSDIDTFLLLDSKEKIHNFLVDNINGIQVTTEIIDNSSFLENIFDTRLLQANIIFDKNKKLENKKTELEESFYTPENIKKRFTFRKNKLQNIIQAYPEYNNQQKILAIFSFIKIYGLIVVDIQKKIPSKKQEFQEVLLFLGEEKYKKNGKN